jgi:hypothetical protein
LGLDPDPPAAIVIGKADAGKGCAGVKDTTPAPPPSPVPPRPDPPPPIKATSQSAAFPYVNEKEGFEDVILCITSGCAVGSLRTPLTPPLVPLGIILSPNFE